MLLTFPCSGGFQSEIEIMVPWALEKGAQETFSCAVHNLVSIIAGLICDKLLKNRGDLCPHAPDALCPKSVPIFS